MYLTVVVYKDGEEIFSEVVNTKEDKDEKQAIQAALAAAFFKV